MKIKNSYSYQIEIIRSKKKKSFYKFFLTEIVFIILIRIWFETFLNLNRIIFII